MKYRIHLPPDYDAGEKRYPVIYHLHGLGGNEGIDCDKVVTTESILKSPAVVSTMAEHLPRGGRGQTHMGNVGSAGYAKEISP